MGTLACPALNSRLTKVPRPCHQPQLPQRRSPGRRSGLAGARRPPSRQLLKQARAAVAARRCQERCPDPQPLRQQHRSGLSACRRLQGLQLALSCPSLGLHWQISARRLKGLPCMHRCSARLLSHHPSQWCVHAFGKYARPERCKDHSVDSDVSGSRPACFASLLPSHRGRYTSSDLTPSHSNMRRHAGAGCSQHRIR